MEEWVCKGLSELLGFPVQEDLTRCVLQMQNERDLDEYFRTLLDMKNPKHKQFVTELKKRQASQKEQSGNKKTNDNNTINRKQKEKKKGKDKGKENTQVQETAKPEKVEKKKQKFVNLYSQEGHDRATILLQGRHKCDCEARKHSLINNCLNCGRIVCAQEGSGPCFFCGDLVCSPQQQAVLSSNTKQADNLYNKLMDQKPSKAFEDSVKQRNRLLEYDRNSTRRTKVIDDESDYYQLNSVWLSAGEREKLQRKEAEISAQKHASRSSKKITLDFAGRQIIEEQEQIDQFDEDQMEELRYESMSFNDIETSNVCPSIEFDPPTYVESSQWKPSGKRTNKLSNKTRIQDKEYLEMTDEGLCLSLHQPYASLLVAGIKTHEGRTWYSSHRGRLWIASASRVPTTEEISSLQHFYRVLKDEKIQFPENYPTGCLLGCVTVVDVLPQEEYRRLYPEGENDSPYVFICEDPYMLPIKFPIQGKHKIYKLDNKIHQAAVKCLERAMKEVRS